MNAPGQPKPAPSAAQDNPVRAFLAGTSLEITPKQSDKAAFLRNLLPQGSRVFIALIDPADGAAQVEAAEHMKRMGLEPVPHVPARFVKDQADLANRLKAFSERAEVKTYLVLGGGAPAPIGCYDAALQLLETGLFQKNGAAAIGIAGHPEGNPDISKAKGEAMLMQTLHDKQKWIKEQGLEGFIATQFLFDAAPLAYWASDLRSNGIDLPIHVGIPGPATIKTLVKYAALCGVGNSARFIRKQALNITKLLSINTPDEFIDQLAKLHFDRPELGIAAPHIYPFGGFERLNDWLKPKLGLPLA